MMKMFDTTLNSSSLSYRSLDELDIFEAIRTAADLTIDFYERQMGVSWQFQNNEYPMANISANISQCVALGYTAGGKVVGLVKDSHKVVELANSNLVYRDSEGYACTVRHEKFHGTMPDGVLEEVLPKYNEECCSSGHYDWQILVFADLYDQT